LIGWRIMLMTLLMRECPTLGAEGLFSDLEIKVLTATAKKLTYPCCRGKSYTWSLKQDFAARVLPFDLNCASVYADLVAKQQSQGRAIAMADAQIAATCLANTAQLATRQL